MKKIFLFVSALMLSVSMNAVDFLVQTGAAGDAVWTSSVAPVVDLTNEGTTLDAWLTAHNGKEVWLAAGTYNTNAVFTYNPNTKIYGGFAGTETSIDERAVDVEAWEMTNATIINGMGGHSIITATGARVAIFDGLTFTNGVVASGNAGAAQIRDGVVLSNCQFIGNKAEAGQGGAVLMNGGGKIENCYFKGNSASYGGAVHVGGTRADGTMDIIGCVFDGNTANVGNKQGGALRSQAEGLIVKNCFFINNEATSNGGAIYTQKDVTDANVFINCVIYGTKSKHGIYMRGASAYNCTFVDNVAGAAYMVNATVSKLVNCVFWSSDASTSTPGQVSGAAAVTAESIIENCAGVKFAGNATQTNCIILEKGVNEGTTEGKNYPFFTDPEENDYTVKAGSAMIGAAKVLANVTTDILGEERSATAPTIGAYEYIKSAPTGVETSPAPSSRGVIRLVDGQVVIMRNGEMYNVQGAKL